MEYIENDNLEYFESYNEVVSSESVLEQKIDTESNEDSRFSNKVQDKNKRFQCSLCDVSCATKSNLLRHFTNIHEEKKSEDNSSDSSRKQDLKRQFSRPDSKLNCNV